MKEKRADKYGKWRLWSYIAFVAAFFIVLWDVRERYGDNMMVDILACVLLSGVLFVVALVGGWYFYLKPFPLRPDGSREERPAEDSWMLSVTSIVDNRCKQLMSMSISVAKGFAGFLAIFLFVGNKMEKVNMKLALAGVFTFLFLLFTHGWALFAYTRECKRCSVVLSKEAGIWLLEVTDEARRRLIQADILGLFILWILLGYLFNLRY